MRDFVGQGAVSRCSGCRDRFSVEAIPLQSDGTGDEPAAAGRAVPRWSCHDGRQPAMLRTHQLLVSDFGSLFPSALGASVRRVRDGQVSEEN